MRSSLRVGVATSFAALAVAVGAPVAGATVQLFPSASPLPGSSFQGADGNQTPANATTKLDWKDFKSDPDLKTLVDPSNPDREFGGGSSEDKPDTWTFSDPADSTPAKANFRVAWDLFKPDPGRLLQLAFRRAANGGNAFLAFELNQDPQLWTNSVGTKIPCRTTGDLLITYNVSNSDATEIYLTVQKWTSTSSDPATGCGRTGTLSELPSSALTDGVNVQEAVNSATSNAISPELPSPPAGLPNNEKGAIPSEMESGPTCGSASNWICGGLFGETAINLPSVFDKYQSNPCFSFGSVWAHGRSSISQSSALQDYVEPASIAVRSCTASGFKFNDLNANGIWDKPAEPAVEGWKVWLDKNKDGKVDAPAEIATTNATGEYLFTGLSAGTYTIKELTASDQSGGLQNLDVCSKPAPCSSGYSVTISATNLTSTGNTFGNYANPRLELVKSLNPTSDPGLFNLKAQQTSGGSGSISSTDSGNGQGTGKKTVTPGSWALTETAGTGTNLANYTPSLACKARGSGTPVAVTSGSISLSPGDDVICTFTNTRKTGTVTVDKSLSPSDDPGLFNLLIGGKVYATDVGDDGTTGKQTLNTGSWSIGETAGTSTSLDDYASDLACEDAKGPVTVEDGKVTLGDGQAITCTFTNTRKTGEVKLTKKLSPSDDPGLFDLLIGGKAYAADVGDGGTTGFQELNTGTWSIGESAGTDTSLDDYKSEWTCEDAKGKVDITDGKVELSEGQKISCAVTNTRKTGTITVNKSLSPSDDPGLFNLLIGGKTYASDVGDGGTTGKQNLNTGSYSIAEAAGTGTSLDDYASDLACEDAKGPVTVEGGQVTLGDGQAITCTFTNTRKTGQIELTKDLVPSSDPGLFNLLIGGKAYATDVGDGGTTGFQELNTGTWSIGESAGTGTSLDDYATDYLCEDSEGPVKIIDGKVELSDGQKISCAVTNTRKTGTITVNKSLSPSDDPGLFNLLIGGKTYASDVGDGGTTGKQNLNTGSYSIEETPGADTALGDYKSGLECEDNEGAVDVTEGQLTLSDGQDIICTFTNTRKTGNLKLVKNLSPTGDSGLFNLLLNGATKAVNVGDGGASDTLTVNTGSYTVSEAAGTGTSLSDYTSSASCEAGGQVIASGPVTSLQVSVASGESVTCTFVNTRNTGTIKLVKQLSPASDPGLFNLQLDGTTQAANVGDGGTSGALTVNTGSHTVSELAGTGTSLSDYTSSASCEAGGEVIASGPATGLSVAVATGQAVTCTFTNTRNPVPPPPNGTIIIAKNTTDSSVASFGFGGDLGSFTLSSGSGTSFSQPAGTYSVSEIPASGYSLSSLVCSDAGDAAGSSSISGSTALVNLQAGETVVCTFTNAPSGGVLPAIAGSARVSGSQGCVSGRYAYVRVRGTNIARVTYYVSGKKVKTLTERNSRGRYYELRYPVSKLKPGASKRVTASVLYVSGASPASTTLRWRIVRCAAKVKPGFTG